MKNKGNYYNYGYCKLFSIFNHILHNRCEEIKTFRLDRQHTRPSYITIVLRKSCEVLLKTNEIVSSSFDLGFRQNRKFKI